MVKVSVIIPCYNQGCYVSEAVDSVLAQTFRDFEIIIVNDGSTDDKTNTILKTFKRDRTKVITTANQGLAAARNAGIAEAAGEYILPLDADDRIAPAYLEEGVSLLDSEAEVGIVYSRARLFGAVNCEWNLPRYCLEEMVKDNIIFCSALFRRSDWETVGGYDPGMIYGWEDYDFWLSLIERGREVRRLDSHLFFYRVSADSMVRTKEKWQKAEMFTRIYHRHRELISQNIAVWIENLIEQRERYHTCRLYLDTGNGFNEEESIGRKITEGSQHLVFNLEHFPPPRRIRIDPVDSSACVRIDFLILKQREAPTRLAVDRLPSNAACRIGNVLMFSDTDPQIRLPALEDERTIHSLELGLTLLSVGEQSLREIIEYQKQHLLSPPALYQKFAGWWRRRTQGQN